MKVLFLTNIFLLLLPGYSIRYLDIPCYDVKDNDEALHCSCLRNIQIKMSQYQSNQQQLDFDYQRCLRRLHDDRSNRDGNPQSHNPHEDHDRGGTPPHDDHEGTRPPRDDHDGTPPSHDDREGTRPPHDDPAAGTPPPNNTRPQNGNEEHDDTDETQKENSENDTNEESHSGSHFSSSAVALLSVGCAIVAAIFFGIMLNVLRFRFHTPSPPPAFVTTIPMVEIHETIILVDSEELSSPSFVVATPVNHYLDEENQAY